MRAPWEGPAGVLDGKATAAAIKAELKERVDRLREAGVVPGLGTILVGEDPGSVAYVAGKHRDCAEIGAESIRVDLPADATQEQVEAAIDQLNADPACTGYIVQLPLPRGIDTNAVLERIDPAKDADGLHPMNLGRLVLRGSGPIDSPAAVHAARGHRAHGTPWDRPGRQERVRRRPRRDRGAFDRPAAHAQGSERDGRRVPHGHDRPG